MAALILGIPEHPLAKSSTGPRAAAHATIATARMRQRNEVSVRSNAPATAVPINRRREYTLPASSPIAYIPYVQSASAGATKNGVRGLVHRQYSRMHAANRYAATPPTARTTACFSRFQTETPLST